MRDLIRLLHLRQLRSAWLRSALAALAVAAGVGLVVAVLVDRDSVASSAGELNRSVAGHAQLRVDGPVTRGGLTGDQVRRLRAIDGVVTVIPVVRGVTYATDASGRDHLLAVAGVDCGVETLLGRFGCDPVAVARSDASTQPVLSPSLARLLGPGAALRHGLGRTPLDGAQVADALDRINEGRLAVLPLPAAQVDFGRGDAVDTVYLALRPAASATAVESAVRAGLGDQVVVADATSTSGGVAAATILPILLTIGLVGLAVGAQLAAGVIALLLEQRRRDLAITSALGGGRRLLLAGITVEAIALGLAGGTAGVVIGVVAAHPLVSNLNAATQTVGIHLAVHVHAGAVIAGLLLGVLAATAAAIGPALRASRIDVAAELHAQHGTSLPTDRAATGRPAVVEGVLAVVGVAMTWAGQRHAALDAWQPPVAQAGVLLTVAAGFACAAAVAAPLLRHAGRGPGLRGATGQLAVSGLVANRRRTASSALAIAATVGLGVVLTSFLGSIRASTSSDSASQARGGVLLYSSPVNNAGAIEGHPLAVDADRLATAAGVEAVDSSAYVTIRHPSVGTIGVNAIDGLPDRYRVVAGEDGDTALAAGHVMVGTGLARRLHLRPGSLLRLPGRSGTETFTVGGIWDDPNEIGNGICLRLDQATRLWGPRAATSYRLRPSPGTTAAALITAVQGTPHDPALHAYDVADLSATSAREYRSFLASFFAFQRAQLAVILLATLTTFLLATLQRRHEHGLLAALGATPAALARLVLTESGLLGITGTILGAALAALILRSMTWISPLVTGTATPYALDVAAPFRYGALATAAALIGAALPAYRASRLDPADALREE